MNLTKDRQLGINHQLIWVQKIYQKEQQQQHLKDIIPMGFLKMSLIAIIHLHCQQNISNRIELQPKMVLLKYKKIDGYLLNVKMDHLFSKSHQMESM